MLSADAPVEQQVGGAYECACGVSFKHSSSYSRHQRRKCCSAATHRYSLFTAQQLPQRKRRRGFDAVQILASEKNNLEMHLDVSAAIESAAIDPNDDDNCSSSHNSSSPYASSAEVDNDEEDLHYLADVWNESAHQDEKRMANE